MWCLINMDSYISSYFLFFYVLSIKICSVLKFLDNRFMLNLVIDSPGISSEVMSLFWMLMPLSIKAPSKNPCDNSNVAVMSRKGAPATTAASIEPFHWRDRVWCCLIGANWMVRFRDQRIEIQTRLFVRTPRTLNRSASIFVLYCADISISLYSYSARD